MARLLPVRRAMACSMESAVFPGGAVGWTRSRAGEPAQQKLRSAGRSPDDVLQWWGGKLLGIV